jgi:periplasmic divalent cation tolerance protein
MNRIVISTTGSQEEARRIARELVERRLAACVNILGPTESVYRWQGKVEVAGEFLLLIKTTAARFADVRDALTTLHSYDVPECIALDITEGSPQYLAWLADSVS